MTVNRLADYLDHMRQAIAEHQKQIPWRSMRGMRNRIAHGYFDINLDVVWDTVQAALPELATQLEALPPA